jgi:hypothetical protein
MFNRIQFAHIQYARAHEWVPSKDVRWLAGGLLLDFGLRISNWFPSTSLTSWGAGGGLAMTVFGLGFGSGDTVYRSLGVRLGYLSAFLGMNEGRNE